MTYIIPAIGDLHINSSIGLCAPLVKKDSGDSHIPSKTQLYIRDCFDRYWDDVKGFIGVDDTVITVILGETVDVDYKNRTDKVISRSEQSVLDHAQSMLRVVHDISDAEVYLKGTDAHLGKDGKMDNLVARDSDKHIPDLINIGSHAWVEYELQIGKFTLHANHHGPIGRSAHTRTNPLMLKAVKMLEARVRNNRPIPSVALQGHNHIRADTGNNQIIRVVAVGCWQGMSAYASRYWVEEPDIGGIIILTDGDKFEVVDKYYPLKPPKVWGINFQLENINKE